MVSSIASRAGRGILGTYVERSATLPPGSGSSVDLFSVDTGDVLLTGFYGLVTAAIPASSIDFDLAHDPDDGNSDVVLATLLAVDSFAANTYLSLNTTAGGALVGKADAAYNVALATPILLGKGDIKLNVAGGGTIGSTARAKWGLWYLPIGTGGKVTAV